MSQVLCGGWGHGRAQGQDGRPETHCQSNRRYVEYGSCVTHRLNACCIVCVFVSLHHDIISLPASLPALCVPSHCVCVPGQPGGGGELRCHSAGPGGNSRAGKSV